MQNLFPVDKMNNVKYLDLNYNRGFYDDLVDVQKNGLIDDSESRVNRSAGPVGERHLFVHHHFNRINIGSAPRRIKRAEKTSADGNRSGGENPVSGKFKFYIEDRLNQISR